MEKDKLTNPFDFLIQGCDRPWEVAIEPFKVAPHVYYVGNTWVGAYLIDTKDGLILIDSTMHNQVYLVFESIRKLGFDPRNIKMLLLSHAHYDHCGGVRPIIEYTGAKLYMGKEDVYFLTERPDLIFTEGYAFGKFQADYYYDDNKPITLGDMTIHTIHTPGHTPGTTSFFFEDKDEYGIAYRCGLHGGIGLNTLADDLLKESGWSVSIREDFLNDLLKLRDRKIDITLGSHPNQVHMLERVNKISKTYNPFLDKTVWPKLMDERVLAVRELMANSKISR
jgi:metallo-beta-lactamase class B